METHLTPPRDDAPSQGGELTSATGGSPPSPMPDAPASGRREEMGRRLRLIGAAVLGVAIFLVDTLTPANIEFAALYVVVLLLVGRGSDARRIWYWTLGCLVGSVVSFVVLVDPAKDPAAVARYGIAVVTIICTAFLIAKQGAAQMIVRRQSRALDVAGTAILLRSRSGEILLWNRAAEELYGWTYRDAIGQNADRLLESRLPVPIETILAELDARGTWEGEIEHRHRNGQNVTVLSRWTLQQDEDGAAPMIVEADVDAHIQRAAELLRISEHRYRTIFDSITVAVLEQDFRDVAAAFDALRAEGVTDLAVHIAEHPDWVTRLRHKVKILDVNDTAVRMLDAPSKDAIGETLADIVPEQCESFGQCLVAMAEARPSFLTETRVRTVSGELVPVIFMLSFPQDGSFERVTGCFVDIRDRLRMQATIDRARSDLEHALRAASLGEISASIAHEVNQPLSAVMSYSQASRRWLNRTPPDVPEALSALNNAIMATEHASNVVKRVRKLMGRTDPDRLPVPIDAAVDEAARLVHNDADANNVAVQLDLGARRSIVLGDRVLLQQVLINLLNNAIQAMDSVTDRERRIALDTRRVDEMIRIRIADTGPGFSDGSAEQAFNAFFTTKPRGMGLGLAICRSTIEAHGGVIRVENREDGPGALVTVELPVES